MPATVGAMPATAVAVAGPPAGASLRTTRLGVRRGQLRGAPSQDTPACAAAAAAATAATAAPSAAATPSSAVRPDGGVEGFTPASGAFPPRVVFVWDTETTGLSSSSRVVELAIRVSSLSSPPLVSRPSGPSEMVALIHPGERIPNTKVHGISDAMVADAPPFGAVWEDVKVFVGAALAARGDDAVALWVAHNARFDCRMLGAELGRLAAAAVANERGKEAALSSTSSTTMSSLPPHRMTTHAGASPASVMATATIGDERGDTPAKAVAPSAAVSPVILPPTWRFVCSMQAFKVAYPALPSYRQEAVAAHVGVVNEAAHRALGDVAALDAVLRHAVARLPGGIEGFWGDKLGAVPVAADGLGGGGGCGAPQGDGGLPHCVLRATIAAAATAAESSAAALVAPDREVPGEEPLVSSAVAVTDVSTDLDAPLVLFLPNSTVYHTYRTCATIAHARRRLAWAPSPPAGRRLCKMCAAVSSLTTPLGKGDVPRPTSVALGGDADASMRPLDTPPPSLCTVASGDSSRVRAPDLGGGGGLRRGVRNASMLSQSLCTGVSGGAAAAVPAGAVTETSLPHAPRRASAVGPTVDLAPLQPGEALFLTPSAVYHSRRGCPMLSPAAVGRATVGPPPPGRRLCRKCKRDGADVAVKAGAGGVAAA
ncbi:hypothetical protein MMPV_003475 [Pyropia vietnamensis]